MRVLVTGAAGTLGVEIGNALAAAGWDVLGCVAVPASLVTSCAFGGPDLEDLFVTTAQEGLDPVQLAAQPLAGAIFRARPGFRGLPSHRFVAVADASRSPQ